LPSDTGEPEAKYLHERSKSFSLKETKEKRAGGEKTANKWEGVLFWVDLISLLRQHLWAESSSGKGLTVSRTRRRKKGKATRGT